MRTKPGGFTFVEFLIVVAIIGIIAAIVIPNFTEAMRRQKEERVLQQIGEKRALTIQKKEVFQSRPVVIYFKEYPNSPWKTRSELFHFFSSQNEGTILPCKIAFIKGKPVFALDGEVKERVIFEIVPRVEEVEKR